MYAASRANTVTANRTDSVIVRSNDTDYVKELSRRNTTEDTLLESERTLALGGEGEKEYARSLCCEPERALS